MQRRNSLSSTVSPLSTPVSSPPGSSLEIIRPRSVSLSEPVGYRMEKLMEVANATVLVIGREPNTVPASTISALLELVGYKVETIADVKDAIKNLAHNRTCIGVMCYVSQLGKDTGIAILKELKTIKGFDLPVIMIACKEATEITSKCFRMGAADVISPPLTAEFLKARLGSTFKHYWMSKEMVTAIGRADFTKQELQDVKEELAALKSKYMDAVHENECFKMSNHMLIQENTKISSELKTSQIEQKRIAQELQVVSAQTIVKESSEDTIRQDNRKLRTRVLELEGIVKGKEIIISELLKKTQQLASKQQRITELEQLVSKLETRNESLLKKFRTKASKPTVLSPEPEEKKASISIEEHEKEIACREEIITKLRTEFQTENDKLDETVKSFQAKFDEQRKTISAKEEETKVLSQQVQSLAWRVALLTSERTSKEVVGVPLTAEEQEILKKAKNIKEQFESPIEVIVANVQYLSGFASSHNLPEEVTTCVRALGRAIEHPTTIFRPSLDNIIESLPMDAASKQWIQTQFTGEPVQIPRNPMSNEKKASLGNVTDSYSRVVVDSKLLKDWLFDSFIRSEEDLVLYAVYMFKDLGLLSHFLIPETTMIHFIDSVKDSHNPNPLHNWRLSFEMAHLSYLFLVHTRANVLLTSLDMFTLLVACLCRNLQHPGLNNIFQTNAKTPLANLYQDSNVLENHAITTAFKLLARSDCNILGELTAEQYKEFRKGFIKVIRSSDISYHLELNSLVNVQHMAKAFSKEDSTDRYLLMSSILHAADLSVVAMPVHSREWMEMAFREHINQGEKEREMNLPVSPFFNRAETSIVRFTVNFIDYIAHPFYVTLQKVLPELDQCLGWIKQNRAYWSKLDSLEATIPEVTESALGVLLERKRPTSPVVDKLIKQKPVEVPEDNVIPYPSSADSMQLSPTLPSRNLRVLAIPKVKHSLSVPDLLPQRKNSLHLRK